MRKALLICVELTRSSSEMSITPNSQAYCISRPLAMMMKLWSVVNRAMNMMMAKVMTVVAIVMHVRLAMKLSVRRRLGRRKRKPK